MDVTLDNLHWEKESYRQRVTRSQAQKILLNKSTIVFKGLIYNLKIKHVGAGIYEIYKERSYEIGSVSL